MEPASQPEAAEPRESPSVEPQGPAGTPEVPQSPKRPLEGQECIQLKVQFGKDSVTVERPLDSTVGDLKRDIEERTGGVCVWGGR